MPEHTFSIRSYVLVYAALIVLTVVTVSMSFVHLGPWHLAVGLAFGVVKALLVALVFMGVWYDRRLTWLVILAALYWFGILMVLTLNDYLTRSWATY